MTATTPAPSASAAPAAAQLNPADMLRSRRYVVLLVLAAVIGAPVSAVAYWFLVLASDLQRWLYTDLPSGLGYATSPSWWPLPILAVAGLLVALVIRYVPGRGGESPADGFHAGHAAPIAIPGIAVAALVTLGSGAVLGPEAPLIALGGGLGAFAVQLAKRDAPPEAITIIAAAGSFAAISTLLGSPLLATFLLMEVSGVGGALLGLVLLPGLLAAGIGSLIFIGLDSWTGYGTFSLAIPNLPPFSRPNIAEFGWALVIGVAAAALAVAIRAIALLVRPHVERRILVLTPIVGVVVGGMAILYAEVADKSYSQVLFSGQTALGPLITSSASYSLGALLLLIACKGLAYGVSLSSFRGGPIFPAMFLGAAGGMAMSHLPGLPLVPAVAMGIGAMSVSMLRLPMTSVLLATLLLLSDGLAVMPLVIVAVVVAHVVTARLPFGLHPEPAPAEPSADGVSPAADESSRRVQRPSR
jgi:H+/Cl- antiporter ClcA